MKFIAILLTLIITLAANPVFAVTSFYSKTKPVTIENGGSFKILNDTDADVQIHTGGGFVELNKGSSTSVTCEAGREIRQANKGKKGDIIFTVDDSMCGKTIKLSSYL